MGRDRASSCNATSRRPPHRLGRGRAGVAATARRPAAAPPRVAWPETSAQTQAGRSWQRKGLSAALTSPRSPRLGKACPVLSESGTRIERLGRGEARPGLTGCSAAFKSELLLEARTPAGSAFKSESLYPSRRLDPGRSRAERTRISLALSHSLSPSPPALPLAPPCRL